MKMIDSQREEFERWCSSLDYSTEKNHDGEYTYAVVRIHWFMWTSTESHRALADMGVSPDFYSIGSSVVEEE